MSRLTEHPRGVIERAEGLLRDSPYQPLKNVSCAYRAGILTLRGRLASYYFKQLAQETVARVDGVERVENLIEVRGPAVPVA